MSQPNTPSSSLDLLLGPMCNTFGVIVLVACITALLAQAPPDNGQTKASPTKELLERRLKMAQGEKEKLNAMLGDSPLPLTPERGEKLTELERLRRILESLQNQTEELDKTIAKSAVAISIDPGLQIRQLKADQRAIQQDIESMNNMIPAMDEQIAQLEQRRQSLEKDRHNASESRTIKMRFPREHSSDLIPFAVIVRHGKVYPLLLANLSKNPDITRTDSDDDSTRCEPILAKGWSVTADREKIDSLFSAIKGEGVYVSIYAYPDSFDICRLFRQAIIDQGLQFGLKAITENQPLFFSSKGSSPPPL